MFCTVAIIGRVGRKINNICRVVEVDRVAPQDGHFVTDEIPCIYWSRLETSYFMELTEGAYVGIKGRLEYDPDTKGLAVIVEDATTIKK